MKGIRRKGKGRRIEDIRMIIEDRQNGRKY